jgi:Spy/CpxP family protein refolding chaperone
MQRRFLRQAAPALMILAVMGLVLAMAAPSWAQPRWGGKMGSRMNMMNLTPEQAGQVFDLRQKFMNETAAQRKEMAVKRAEMMQLWKAEKPDEKAILAKAKELHAIKGQLMEKMVAFRLEMRKIAPQAAFGPMGGPGMGPGMGPGPGKGKGPGACLGGNADQMAGMDSPGDMGMNLAMSHEAEPGFDW